MAYRGWARRFTVGVAVAGMATAGAGAASAAVNLQRTDIATGQVNSLAVGDLDGVNGPDIVTSMTGGGVEVRLNHGDGTFGDAIAASTCAAPKILLGDVTTNGTDLFQDGRLDLVASCANGVIGRSAGDGAGRFGTQELTSAIGLAGGPSEGQDAIALPRWRASGPPVLAFVQAGYDSHSFTNFRKLCASYDWQTSSCDGHGHSASDPDAIGVGPIVTGDVDNADRDEMFTMGGPQGLIGFGVDAGPISYSYREFGELGNNGNYALAMADLDGDGHPDFLTGYGNGTAGAINVLRGSVGGLLPQHPTTYPASPYLMKMVVGDYTGDGRNDVLAAAMTGRAVVYAGNGAGAIDGGQDVPLVGYGDTSTTTRVDLASADVDRNGTADAVVVDRGRGVIQVLRNLNAPVAPPQPSGGGNPLQPIVTPVVKPTLPGPTAPSGSGFTKLVTTVTPTAGNAFTVGQASNPPIRSVVVSLVLVGAKTSAATKRKPTALAATRTYKIPKGKTTKLVLTLNGKARSLLRHQSKIRATLTLKATRTDGSKKTTTRGLTVKRRPR